MKITSRRGGAKKLPSAFAGTKTIAQVPTYGTLNKLYGACEGTNKTSSRAGEHANKLRCLHAPNIINVPAKARKCKNRACKGAG